MTRLGMGVMLKMLSSNEDTVNAHLGAIGKTIKETNLNDNKLIISFTDGTAIEVSDDGQSCCESRYMTTDDDLNYIKGKEFLGFELKEAPKIETEYDEHEVQFLELKTNDCVVTFANHNEHNGYYGGFAIEIRDIN